MPSMRYSSSIPGVFSAIILATSVLTTTNAQVLTAAQLDAVKEDLWLGSHQTWELGVESEALIEFDSPAFSVFAEGSLPPPNDTSTLFNPSSLSRAVQIAYNVAANRSNVTGPQPVMWVEGGGAGDPPSIGFVMLLANWTGVPEPELNRPENASSPFGTNIGKGVTYEQAAREQLEYLLTVVPRTDDGAISMRIETTQVWADTVYMVPPFLAYYGAITGNQSLVEEAYNQCKLYRAHLIDPDTSLWSHILLGNGSHDAGLWSTGDGYAAAGMLRVLATIKHSQYADTMQSEMQDLTGWISEILDGMYTRMDTSKFMFHNYVNDTTWFFDAASTSLVASVAYRLASLTGISKYVPDAELSREALSAYSTPGGYSSWGTGDGVGAASSLTQTTSASASPSSSGLAAPTPTPTNSDVGTGLNHFSPQMWLTPIVDPYTWWLQGGSLPEGEGMVVEMYAAWRDWSQMGSQGPTSMRVRRLDERASGASGCGGWLCSWIC